MPERISIADRIREFNIAKKGAPNDAPPHNINPDVTDVIGAPLGQGHDKLCKNYTHGAPDAPILPLMGAGQGHHRGTIGAVLGHHRGMIGAPLGHDLHSDTDVGATCDESTQDTDNNDDCDNSAPNKTRGTIGAPLGHDRGTILDDKIAENGAPIAPVFTKKDKTRGTIGAPLGHDRGTIRQGHDRGTICNEINLAPKQLEVYKWFLCKGFKSTFNKPLIVKDSGICFKTVRKTITKFINIGLISVSYNKCVKFFEYKINTNIRVKNLDWGQDRGSIGAPLGHDRGSISLNSSSSFFYNNKAAAQDLDIRDSSIIETIMAADPEYRFWTEKNMTPRYVSKLADEYGLESETMLKNLCYLRWRIVKNGETVKSSVEAWLKYILKSTGGVVVKPEGYKSMAQLDAEFFERWKKERAELRRMAEEMEHGKKIDEINAEVSQVIDDIDLENDVVKRAIGLVLKPVRDRIRSRILKKTPLTNLEKSTLRQAIRNVFYSDYGISGG